MISPIVFNGSIAKYPQQPTKKERERKIRKRLITMIWEDEQKQQRIWRRIRRESCNRRMAKSLLWWFRYLWLDNICLSACAIPICVAQCNVVVAQCSVVVAQFRFCRFVRHFWPNFALKITVLLFGCVCVCVRVCAVYVSMLLHNNNIVA